MNKKILVSVALLTFYLFAASEWADANVAGTWNLTASGVSVGCTVNTPCQPLPSTLCGTAICGPFQMGDPHILVSQSGTILSSAGVDTNNNPYALNGSESGNSVTFTISGVGITPGIGPATTTYTGTVTGNIISGSFSGYASWTYINGGTPTTETATWTGTFQTTISGRPATRVGYSPQWLVITFATLVIAGGFLLRRRMARR